MNERETSIQDLEAALSEIVASIPPVTDVIASQLMVTHALVGLMREHLGITNAEIRERALALATAAGVDREGVVAQISAMLPDLPAPVAPDPGTRH